MAQGIMRIDISPYDIKTEHKKIGQTINFINILEGAQAVISPTFSSKPLQIDYSDLNEDITGLINYERYDFDATKFLVQERGLALLKGNQSLKFSVYRCEVDYDESGELYNITPYELVANGLTEYKLRDYNISNGRLYQYIIYPTSTEFNIQAIEEIVQTNWGNWSLTELHSYAGDTTNKIFSAESSDVWVFGFNVETGSQTQNIIKNENETLGQFPRFAQGRKNNLSGDVTCLLGQEILPANYLSKAISVNTNGYQEKLLFMQKLTSNDKVDLLNQWRKIVYSGNPKLLKDRKGQKFLVQISSGSNQPMEEVAIIPDKISFSWVEIGSVDDIIVVDRDLKNDISKFRKEKKETKGNGCL